MTKRILLLSSVLLAGAFAACGGITTNLGTDTNGDGGTGDGTSSSGSASDGGSADIDAGPDNEPHGIPCGWLNGSGPGGDAGSGFVYCPVGFVCSQPPNACRVTGECLRFTSGSDEDGGSFEGGCAALVPSCGCDGRDYCGTPEALAQGVTVSSYPGSCEFSCGSSNCNVIDEYCEHTSGGIPLPDGGSTDTWACKKLPSVCDGKARSCDCLTDHKISSSACSEKDGRILVEQYLF